MPLTRRVVISNFKAPYTSLATWPFRLQHHLSLAFALGRASRYAFGGPRVTTHPTHDDVVLTAPLQRQSRFDLGASTTANPKPARCAVRPTPDEHAPHDPDNQAASPPVDDVGKVAALIGRGGEHPSRTILPKAAITQSTRAPLWVSTLSISSSALVQTQRRKPHSTREQPSH